MTEMTNQPTVFDEKLRQGPNTVGVGPNNTCLSGYKKDESGNCKPIWG